GPTVLLLSIGIFVLLTAYYIIKPVREALILHSPSGAEYKAYMGAAIACVLLFAVPAYSKLVDRVSSGKLITGVALFFASHLMLFYLGIESETIRVHLGLLFFLWVGVFNMMVVATFWSFANEIYSESVGTRVFPVIALGQALGAITGSAIARALSESFGIYPMVLVAGGLLCAYAALMGLGTRREQRHVRREGSSPRAGSKLGAGAFSLVARHRYLALIAAFALVFPLVNTNGEYMLGKLIAEAAHAALRDENAIRNRI